MSTPDYQQGLGFHFDRYEGVIRSRFWVCVAAAVLLVVAALEAVALAVLVPYALPKPPDIVDRDAKTGAVTYIGPLGGLKRSQDEALSEFNLQRYVTARETWDPGAGRVNHNLVYAYSDVPVWEAYRALNERGRPGNRGELYGSDLVQVEVKTISFLEPDRALVRFATTRPARGTTEHWIATVGFTYVEPPPDIKARQQNPLGFVVTHYRRDQEVIRADQNS